MVVRMPFGIEQLRHAQTHEAVGPVFDLLASLIAHDVALKVEFLLRHERPQVAQPVRFEPQQER